MASRVATVPEAISRSLNFLKTLGAIQVSRMEIRILAVEKLTAQAQLGSRISE